MYRKAVELAYRVLAFHLLAWTVLAAGCAGGGSQRDALPARRPPPLEFVFFAADGTRFDSTATRGRATAVLLLTTYDLNSQVVARRLNDLLHSFQPRINVGAIVLEPAKYAVFLEPFKQSLGLRYPVLLADHATLQGQGPFGPVPEVPVVIVLDREGRPLWRLTGPATDEELRRALRDASGSARKTQ
jgi:hypothetical protein